MSYNGSGTFNINSTGQPVVAGTVITASAFNALTADLATGLTTAITKDGQTTTTARITFAQGLTSSLSTDSSSVSTGSIITAGGAGIAKNLYVGGIASFSAQPIFTSLTASSAVATDASKGLVSVTNTGTGNNVLATSPTITTPTISSLSSASATALTLQSAGTTAITVDTSQRVGIGTTSPAAQLSVTGASAAGSSGTVYFTQNAATNYPTLQIRQLGAGGNSGDIQGLRVEVDGTSAGYSVAVNRYGSNYTMLLKNDGTFMVGNSRFSPVGTSNAIAASTYYNEEKLYQLATSSGSFDICTITSAYTYGCLIIECGGTIQYAAADQRSASNRKVAVTFATGSITVANLYTPYVGSFGTINFTYVSDGVLKMNVTGATTGVGIGNGIAWVKVIGGQTSVNSTSTPLGFTLS